LSLFDSFFEILKCLLIGVDEHLVIEQEGKLHIGDNSEVEGQVAMIAAHAIEHVD
jgi:hypothetical protein